MAEPSAVYCVDFGYAEKDGGAVDEGGGEGAAVVGLYFCVEFKNCIVDVDDVLHDGLAVREKAPGDREGGCEGEEGEEGKEELHGGG